MYKSQPSCSVLPESVRTSLKGKQLLEDLYSKYLDRSYTTSIWSELIEP